MSGDIAMRSRSNFVLFLLLCPLVLFLIPTYLESRRAIALKQPFNLEVLVTVFVVLMVLVLTITLFLGIIWLSGRRAKSRFPNVPARSKAIMVRWQLVLATMYLSVFSLITFYLVKPVEALLNLMDVPRLATQDALRLLVLAVLDGIPLGLLAGFLIQFLDGEEAKAGRFSGWGMLRYGMLFILVIGMMAVLLRLDETRLDPFTGVIFAVLMIGAKGGIGLWDRKMAQKTD
jgi:hypothetical protein